jgi:hypothetical protein
VRYPRKPLFNWIHAIASARQPEVAKAGVAKTAFDRDGLAKHTRGAPMRLLSYAYRFFTNFTFLATVYFSLNYVEKYNNRAILAIILLIYSALRAASAIRSFFFFQAIERLELEARRLITLITEGGAQSPLRKQTVNDVSVLRRDGEVASYIDLFFLAAVVLLCVAKIVTD